METRTLSLSTELIEKIKTGYVAAKDVISFIKSEYETSQKLAFPDKPIEQTAMKEIKSELTGNNVSRVVIDKLAGNIILEF